MSAHVVGVVMPVLASGEADAGGLSPGLLLFLLVGGLALVLVFLYRSMRRQMKRINFDPEGTSDHQRMRGDGARADREGGEGPDGPTDDGHHG